MSFFDSNDPPDEAFLSTTQLGERWGKSRVTLWRYVKFGIPGTNIRLSAVKLGGSVLFRRSTVEAIERELEIGPRTTRRRRRPKAA